jgi:hypothetical protein
MEGPWVSNLLEPFNTTSQSLITLTGTAQALYATSQLPTLANYFNYAGKLLHFRGVGQTTSGATPGNFALSILYGSNANNVGSNIVSIVVAWPASQVNTTFMFDYWCRCRVPGASGTLSCQGFMFMQGFGIIQSFFSNPSVFTPVDLTATAYMSPQLFRSGSTAETVQMHDIFFESIN